LEEIISLLREENVKRSLEMLNEAADNGANLIVLPELCNTGYIFKNRQEVYEVAEIIPEGPTMQQWIKVAKERKVYIVAGINELERNGIRCYNSAVLIGPEGYIGTHRKLNLWRDDMSFFEPGNLGYQVFETPIGRIAMLVCYDMWYFENWRILALKGADVVCCPTNWVDVPPVELRTMGTYMAMVNANCNNIFVIAADRIGTERGCKFPGRSLIVGPDGWFRAGLASDNKEEILYAEVNLMDSRRLNWNSMNIASRRTDLYDAAQQQFSNPALHWITTSAC
jgi:N-carbamoylputrescine amidase